MTLRRESALPLVTALLCLAVPAAPLAAAAAARPAARPAQADAPARAQAGEPLDVIRSSNQRITRIARPGHTLTAADVETVLSMLDRISDFPTIARNALGRHWASTPAPQRQEFTRLFARMVGLSSLDKMGRYRADRFDYLDQRIDGDRALVRTRAHYKGKTLALDYTLERRGEAWRIVTYAANGVDSTESYRKQFEQILASESMAALIARLEKRVADFERRR